MYGLAWLLPPIDSVQRKKQLRLVGASGSAIVLCRLSEWSDSFSFFGYVRVVCVTSVSSSLVIFTTRPMLPKISSSERPCHVSPSNLPQMLVQPLTMAFFEPIGHLRPSALLAFCLVLRVLTFS